MKSRGEKSDTDSGEFRYSNVPKHPYFISANCYYLLSTNFFFFAGNTAHAKVSQREGDDVERISGINVELSYANKAVSV